MTTGGMGSAAAITTPPNPTAWFVRLVGVHQRQQPACRPRLPDRSRSRRGRRRRRRPNCRRELANDYSRRSAGQLRRMASALLRSAAPPHRVERPRPRTDISRAVPAARRRAGSAPFTGGALGERASAELTIENTRAESHVIRCLATDVRRADGVGPAFVPADYARSRRSPPRAGPGVAASACRCTRSVALRAWCPLRRRVQVLRHGDARLEIPLQLTPRRRRSRTNTLDGAGQRARSRQRRTARHGARRIAPFEPIAIIGMRGRFPGANDLDTFWENLAEGVESIAVAQPGGHARRRHPRQHLAAARATSTPRRCSSTSTSSTPSSSASRRATPRSPTRSIACSSRPAGRRSRTPATIRRRFRAPIGVFGGCELSTYLYQLSQNPDALQYIDGMQLMVTNDKDHLCTQASYRLEPARPERRRADHLLDVAGGRVAGVREPAGRPLRHGAGRRRDRARAAARRLLLHRRIDPVAGRPLPAVRRQRAGHDRRQRRRPRRAEASRATRVADGDNIRAVILGAGITTTATTKSATPRRASAARPRRSARRTPMAGVVAGIDRLRRSARHRHDPRRPDRDVGAERGVHGRHRPPRILRDRLGEVELRPSLVRGRASPV